jgi:hypothetical protein
LYSRESSQPEGEEVAGKGQVDSWNQIPGFARARPQEGSWIVSNTSLAVDLSDGKRRPL